MHFDSFQFFFALFNQIFSPKVCFQLTFIQQHCSIIVWLLFEYCLIIVQYSDKGNMFQVFQSRKEVPITYNLESINNKSSTWLAYFCLSSLRAWLYDPGWVSHLPWLLLGLRAAPRKTAASCSQRWCVGQPLLCPGSSWPRSGSPSRRGHHETPESFLRLQSAAQEASSRAAASVQGAIQRQLRAAWKPCFLSGPFFDDPFAVVEADEKVFIFQDFSPAGARGVHVFISKIIPCWKHALSI